jgi:hypothetical protein
MSDPRHWSRLASRGTIEQLKTLHAVAVQKGKERAMSDRDLTQRNPAPDATASLTPTGQYAIMETPRAMSDPHGWPDPKRRGVPMNPERSRWHWLLWHGNEHPTPVEWTAGKVPVWDTGARFVSPEEMARHRSYLGPCLTPAEVAARVAEAKREGMREAAGIAARVGHGLHGTPEEDGARDCYAAILAAAEKQT